MRTILLLLLSGVYAIAQTSSGNIVGSVTDQSGAVLAGAKVIMRHLATAETREIASNDRGEFTASFLRVGDYSLTATNPGFKAKTISPITVRVDQTVTLPMELEVGAVSESVEVTATTPLLDSATSLSDR